jgi:hypothetical protein
VWSFLSLHSNVLVLITLTFLLKPNKGRYPRKLPQSSVPRRPRSSKSVTFGTIGHMNLRSAHPAGSRNIKNWTRSKAHSITPNQLHLSLSLSHPPRGENVVEFPQFNGICERGRLRTEAAKWHGHAGAVPSGHATRTTGVWRWSLRRACMS